MKGSFFTLLLGVVFALGLGISEMTRPEKILSFLNVLGDWDPSLLIVMAVGILVYYPLQLWIKREHRPLYAECYVLPKAKSVDIKLILGAGVFGLGWGLLGLCPGPAVTLISTLKPELLVFLFAVGVGMIAADKLV